MQKDAHMQPLTRDAVQQLLGDVDDQVIADVISTGANQADLEVALERLRDTTWIDREVDPHVVALCDVLAPILAREDDDEIYATD
jgi:hypothetical protein